MLIVYPDMWEIPEETVAIHGITMERALREGLPFPFVLKEFIEDCLTAKLIIGHNIYFDVSTIKANILRYASMGKTWYDEEKCEEALWKGKRIDTMRKTMKFVGACAENSKRLKYPKLEELYDRLFPGETFPAHNSLEDVRAVVRCVPELVKLGIIELKQKEYPEEQKPADVEQKPEDSEQRNEVREHENEVREHEKQVTGKSKNRDLLDETEF